MKPYVPGRLQAQRLTGPRFSTAAQVVRHLGCVQSQLHDQALWGVARRTDNLTLAELQQTFDAGAFLRTHILRPTWHFVDPDDVHWLLTLTAPRIRRLLERASVHLDRSAEVIEQLMSDGAVRTRAEIGAVLDEAGLPGTGQPLGDVVMNAEINALIVSGPMRGKQHTYRALPPRQLTDSRDDLLARIARRYSTGHGPVRDKDLAWWSGLTLGDSRRAIALGELHPIDVEGEKYWTVDVAEPVSASPVMLLPNFDEYISYARDADDYAASQQSANELMRRAGLLLIDGRLAGSWGRSITGSSVQIEVDTSAVLTPRVMRALDREADSFGAFIGREVHLTFTG